MFRLSAGHDQLACCSGHAEDAGIRRCLERPRIPGMNLGNVAALDLAAEDPLFAAVQEPPQLPQFAGMITARRCRYEWSMVLTGMFASSLPQRCPTSQPLACKMKRTF